MSSSDHSGPKHWRCTSAMVQLAIAVLVAELLVGCDSDQNAEPLTLKPSQVLKENAARIASSRNLYGPSVRIKASRPWRIAFLMKNFAWGSPYWRRTQQGAEAANQAMGTSLRVLGIEEYAIEDQIRQFDNLIREGRIDGVIIAPADSNRLSPVVEKAIAAGIPVIVYDTPLNADGPLTFVGFDNFNAGKLLGRWVVEQLDGHGKVLILEGPSGNQNALERRNGLIAGLSDGDIDVLGIRMALWNRQAAQTITAEWLERHGEIDAILAANDMMALGAIDAMTTAGRTGIVVTGFDANADALLAIRNGHLHATVDQAPTQQARRAMHLMVRHLESGVSFPPVLLFDSIHLITAENVLYYQR